MTRILRLAALVLAIGAVPQPLQAQDWIFRPIIGGLPAESGVSVGVELFRPHLAGPVDFRFRAIGSLKMYEHLEMAFEVPYLGGPGFFLELNNRYRSYKQEDFWGLGPDSSRDDRSNYRLQDFDTTAVFGLDLGRGFQVAATGGLLLPDIGAGRDGDLPSLREVFAPSEVPGLGPQPDYLHGGALVRFDTRDESSDPWSGGIYELRWTRFQSRDGAPFSFRRSEVSLRHFLPTGEKSRVALRALAIFNNPSSGHEVPFFLQPFAGGIDTVRGLRQYRFRGRNALILNAEYRHQLKAFLDLLAFADAGTVFLRAGDFAFGDLKPAGGFGTRLKFGRRVFAGIDVGVGSEGARWWLRAGHAF